MSSEVFPNLPVSKPSRARIVFASASFRMPSCSTVSTRSRRSMMGFVFDNASFKPAPSARASTLAIAANATTLTAANRFEFFICRLSR
jgi:hypothetical protein